MILSSYFSWRSKVISTLAYSHVEPEVAVTKAGLPTSFATSKRCCKHPRCTFTLTYVNAPDNKRRMVMQVERLTLEAHSADAVITTVDAMRPPPSPVWKPSPVTISIPPNTGPTKVWSLATTMAHNTLLLWMHYTGPCLQGTSTYQQANMCHYCVYIFASRYSSLAPQTLWLRQATCLSCFPQLAPLNLLPSKGSLYHFYGCKRVQACTQQFTWHPQNHEVQLMIKLVCRCC